MALTDKVKKFAKRTALFTGIIGIAAGVFTGVTYLANSIVHNQKFCDATYLHLEKTDGPFKYAKLEIYKDAGMVIIKKGSSFSSNEKIYIDKDGDKKIDTLKIMNSNGEMMLFYRDKNSEEHTLFVDGDRIFQEQLERFKPDIDEWKELYE